MNILFISFDADPPYKGGVATVTNVLAKSFISSGHFCALAFLERSETPSELFMKKILLEVNNRTNVELFFKENQFDIILNQLPTRTDLDFLLSMPLGTCKIISVYHSRPMLHSVLICNLMTIYNKSNNILYKLYTLSKIIALPILNIISKRNQINQIKKISTVSDKVLLLSKNFFSAWLRLVPTIELTKLETIGNPLVFDKLFPIMNIGEKEKLIISVSSTEHVKRVDMMLHIWKKIEDDDRFNQWHYEFVGGGENLNQAKALAKKLKIERMKFVGYQNPYPFYERASLMMMTSKYEGWPMVLMEGQQMGVIPIAFNSFESITDIINDGENGFIVPNNNLKYFVDKMKLLMLCQDTRKRMAMNAISGCKRFRIDIVTDKYLKLFADVTNDKLITSTSP